MCTVSMIGDHYADKWRDYKPIINIPPSFPYQQLQQHGQLGSSSNPTRSEFDKLKAEVEEMKKLLERAVDYDKRNHQPHCEQENKMKFLRQVAEFVGVNLDDVLKPHPASQMGTPNK